MMPPRNFAAIPMPISDSKNQKMDVPPAAVLPARQPSLPQQVAMRHRAVPEHTEGGLRATHGAGDHVAPLFDPEDNRSAPVAQRALKLALSKLTFLRWIRTYSRLDLFADVRAGLTVSVVLIPQAIAYALLVEVDPIIGLYSSFIPLIVFALVSTSRHMSIGPFALISLVVASVAKGLVPETRTNDEVCASVCTQRLRLLC
jgi:hypothetical protein